MGCESITCSYGCAPYRAFSTESKALDSCIFATCEVCYRTVTPKPSQDKCLRCLDACHGLSGCCTGQGCICQSSC